MLKWLILILVCLFVFAYPDQFVDTVTWTVAQIYDVVGIVRELLGIPVV